MVNQNVKQHVPILLETFSDGTLIRKTSKNGQPLKQYSIRGKQVVPSVHILPDGTPRIQDSTTWGFLKITPGIASLLENHSEFKPGGNLQTVLSDVFTQAGLPFRGYRVAIVERTTPFVEGQNPVMYPTSSEWAGEPMLTKDGKPFYRQATIVPSESPLVSEILDKTHRKMTYQDTPNDPPKETVNAEGKVIGDTSDEQ